MHVGGKQIEVTRQQLRAQIMTSIANREAALSKLKYAQITERIAREQTEAEQARFAAGASVALEVRQAEDSWSHSAASPAASQGRSGRGGHQAAPSARPAPGSLHGRARAAAPEHVGAAGRRRLGTVVRLCWLLRASVFSGRHPVVMVEPTQDRKGADGRSLGVLPGLGRNRDSLTKDLEEVN